MRAKLNENPMLQAVVLGILALIVGFLVFTRVVSGGAEAPPAESTDATATEATTAPATDASTAAPATTAPAASTPAPEAATPTEAAPPAGAAAPAVDPAGFVAGPGLPADVVKAYAENKVVVLLIVRGNGSDDLRVAAGTAALGDRSNIQVFVVRAADIAKYSRITQGVNVNRTPALVVIEPRGQMEGALPSATVAYGFRGPASITQAVDDALYKGKENLPYYP